MPAGRRLSIGGVRPDRREVPRYGRVELTVDLHGSYANPFDPTEIELNGLVTTPAGRRIIVPGFYSQDYSRSLQGDQEQLTPQGRPGWRLRICASEVGTYRVIAVARGRSGEQAAAAPVEFTALASRDPGFVRRSGRSRSYFQFDSGAPYVPIGANICWGNGPGTFSYDRWLARYSGANCTYGRLWLGPTWTSFGVDRQGLGKIDLANAWRLDYVLNLAEKDGLYLMLCLDSYNELRYAKDGASPFWEQTPHNAANGGPLQQPGEFWTNPEMDRLYRNRLRYLVARYGASTHVLAWEFWNEVDIVSPAAWDEEQVRAWHSRMGRYLHGLDPYAHLVTTSFSSSAGKPSIDRLPELDFVQTHTYGARDMTGEIVACQRGKSPYDKPHYVGECGLGGNEGIDREGVNLHNVLWSGFFSGGAGTGMLWWWDSHIDPNNLYSHFAPVSKFMKGIDPGALDLRPQAKVELTYASPPTEPLLADLELPASDRSWDPCPANRPTTVRIRGDSELQVETALSGLLHGTKNHPDLHNPVTVHLDLPRPTQFVVQVSGVSGYGGACLVLRLDDRVVLSKEMPVPDGTTGNDTLHQYDGAYPVAVPAGPHRLSIEDTGTDWIYVGYLVKNGRTATEPPLRVLALRGADVVLAWVQNPENEWYRVDVQKQLPRPVPPSVLALSGLADGPYRVTLWDTYRGVVTRTLHLASQNGSLAVPLPELRKDLAVKAVREE